MIVSVPYTRTSSMMARCYGDKEVTQEGEENPQVQHKNLPATRGGRREKKKGQLPTPSRSAGTGQRMREK